MPKYFVEYSYDDGQGPCEITCSDLTSRKSAMARARQLSRLNDGVFYVLDENRTGHIAYVSGAVDHREGAAI